MHNTTEEPQKNTPNMPEKVPSKPEVVPGKVSEDRGRDLSPGTGPSDRDMESRERKMGGQPSGRSVSPEPESEEGPHGTLPHPGAPTPTHEKIEPGT